MDYEHHIFVSYRRMDGDWVRWTRENFVRPLRSLLRPALGEVRIFVDDQIESGVAWPVRLAEALAHSRLLIPILSRDYFNSDWCQLELALMLDRERQCGLRTLANPEGLILPFVIDDGDTFPPEVQAMQCNRIYEFANPYMLTTSPRQEEFAEHLRLWCPCVEQALDRVPPFDLASETIAHEQFQHMFQTHVAAQTTVPGLSLKPSAGTALPP